MKFSCATVTDPTLPDVTLEIGGRDRKLAFDMASILTVEQQTGVNLMAAALTEVSATSMRAVLYAALLHDDPDLSIEQVGKWIDFRTTGVIQQAILAAWYGSLPKAKDDDAGEDQAQANL